jgi:thymidylate kinase
LSLPHAQDDIYKWPSDLLKPDIVLLLNVSEEIRLERHSRRNAASITSQEKLLKDDIKFRQDVLQAYANMREP